MTANISVNENANEARTFYYGGSHLYVASLMAVNAAGVKDWATLFKIFKEKHSVFQGDVTPAAPIELAGLGAYFPFSNGDLSPNPAGALRYRAGDYAAFLEKLWAHQVIAKPYLEEMFKDQMADMGAAIEYSPTTEWNEVWHYGLGAWSECPSPVWTEGCQVSRYSSPGSFGSYPFVDLNFYGAQSFGLIGFIARGGSDPGTGSKGISIYRSLLSKESDTKDLAQRWAANSCP